MNMNSVFSNIYARRAVREYKPEDVPDEIVNELILAGIYAPSALNEQPWRFVVIKNKGLIKNVRTVRKSCGWSASRAR